MDDRGAGWKKEDAFFVWRKRMKKRKDAPSVKKLFGNTNGKSGG